MWNVYAFCRWADDLGDEVEGSEASLELLSWWWAELIDCFAGVAQHPVFVALSRTVEEFRLRPEPFADLISAFEQDQTVTAYETDEQLRDYCRRSADPVGRIVLRLFGEDTERNIAWSDSVCTGLQLINFWQDVSRDADMGRMYLPAERRTEFGYTDVMLAQRETNTELTRLMSTLVDEARADLQEGRKLAAVLSGRLRMAVELFYRGGLCVADKVAAGNYQVWTHRPKVGKVDVAKMFASSLLGVMRRRR